MDNLLSIGRIALNCAEVLLIFNLLIIVHELGHFLAAKWRGLVIEGFGIWFGPPIWQKKINGVVYSLGSIPAGGFVKLPQMAPMDVIEGKNDVPREELPTPKALDKIIVAFAGPLFSLMLAFVFATIVWIAGKPTTESEATTTIGYVEKGGPADLGGLKAGDRILSIDGRKVVRFLGQVDSVTWGVIRSEGEKINFEIERQVDGAPKILNVQTGWTKETNGRFRRASLRQVGIAPKNSAVIAEVQPGSPAAAAGLTKGDEIRSFNGEPLFNPIALALYIEDHPGAPLKLNISRADRDLAVDVTPALLPGEKTPRIGIRWDLGEVMLVHPGPLEQVSQSLAAMGNMLGALFSPKSDVKAQHFSGPVGIMNLYFRMLTSPDGWLLAIWFSVLFNVNLAVLNMLPIPVLDGGHILLAIIEGIRKRPVSAKIQETITTACAMCLIGFMLYVTFYDVQDLPFGFGKKKPVAEEAVPAVSPAK